MSATRYGSTSLLKFNIQFHLNRKLVNDGYYNNVASGSLAVDFNREDVLKRLDARTYESLFNNWVYETDAAGCTGNETINASGVVIDGIFHAKNAAPYFPKIDYDNGRILFGADVPVNSTVETQFTYKHVAVDFPDSDIVNFLNSLVKDNVDFTPLSYPSGNQRQTPAIIIDPQSTISLPRKIGGGQIQDRLVVFHIIANNEGDLDSLCDFLTEKHFRTVVRGVDFNITPQLFTNDGDRASTYLNYSTMQASGALAWENIYIDRARLVSKDRFFDFHTARVEWNVTIYRPAASLL